MVMLIRSLSAVDLALQPVQRSSIFRQVAAQHQTVFSGKNCRRMKANGLHDSWTTIRNEFGTTTSFERRDGHKLRVRKTATADAGEAPIYAAIDIAAPLRNLQKTIV